MPRLSAKKRQQKTSNTIETIFLYLPILYSVQYMSVQQWAECHCPVSTRQSSKKPITRCVDAHFDVLTNKATKLTLIRINSKSPLYFKTAQTRKHITVNTIDALTVQKGIRRHTADLLVCKENTAKNVKDTQDGGQTLLLGQYI